MLRIGRKIVAKCHPQKAVTTLQTGKVSDFPAGQKVSALVYVSCAFFQYTSNTYVPYTKDVQKKARMHICTQTCTHMNTYRHSLTSLYMHTHMHIMR